MERIASPEFTGALIKVSFYQYQAKISRTISRVLAKLWQ